MGEGSGSCAAASPRRSLVSPSARRRCATRPQTRSATSDRASTPAGTAARRKGSARRGSIEDAWAAARTCRSARSSRETPGTSSVCSGLRPPPVAGKARSSGLESSTLERSSLGPARSRARARSSHPAPFWRGVRTRKTAAATSPMPNTATVTPRDTAAEATDPRRAPASPATTKAAPASAAARSSARSRARRRARERSAETLRRASDPRSARSARRDERPPSSGISGVDWGSCMAVAGSSPSSVRVQRAHVDVV
jgi:hypothetical protein